MIEPCFYVRRTTFAFVEILCVLWLQLCMVDCWMYHMWNANGLVLFCLKEENEAPGLLGHKEFTSGGRDTLKTVLLYGIRYSLAQLMNPIRLCFTWQIFHVDNYILCNGFDGKSKATDEWCCGWNLSLVISTAKFSILLRYLLGVL